eukprot:COSAG02_NODE_5222_length_4527_cov_134.379630_1_plen_181_part_00
MLDEEEDSEDMAIDSDDESENDGEEEEDEDKEEESDDESDDEDNGGKAEGGTAGCSAAPAAAACACVCARRPRRGRAAAKPTASRQFPDGTRAHAASAWLEDRLAMQLMSRALTAGRRCQFRHIPGINARFANRAAGTSGATGGVVQLDYYTAWFCPFAHRATLALEHHAPAGVACVFPS